MANKTYNDHATDSSPASTDLVPFWDAAAGAAKKATRAKIVGATITGDGTIATGGYTLTVPATGTAALLGVANTFTANQSISGKLGIGTASPTTTLHVTRNVLPGAGVSTDDTATFEDSVSTTVNLVTATTGISGVYFSDATRARGRVNYNHSTNSMLFYTAGLRRVTIDSAGNVGIGTDSPSYMLDVSGDINASGSVRSNGTPLTSDGTLKDAPTPTADALTKLAAVRGYEFTWSDKARQMGLPDGVQHGLIAQEVEQIFPDLVSEWEVETGEYIEGDDGEQMPVKERIKCVDYARMVPILLEAVRELAGRVDALTSAAKA